MATSRRGLTFSAGFADWAAEGPASHNGDFGKLNGVWPGQGNFVDILPTAKAGGFP